MARSDFRFAYSHRVKYHEVDRQDVVFFGQYLTYFSVAIVEFLRKLDSLYRGGNDGQTVDFHIVKSLVEYREAIEFDLEIDICIDVARIGHTSITYAFEIHPLSEDRLLARGEIVWAAKDRVLRKSVPIPQDLIDKIKLFQEGAVSAVSAE